MATDDGLLRLIILLVPIVIAIAVLLVAYFRLKRKARTLRAELSRQRRDALRSVSMMIGQMEYDAEVLRLMRHARASKDRQNESDFNAAIDRLVKRENDMMARVDSASEFGDYLQRTYRPDRPFGTGGAEKRGRDGPVKVLSRPGPEDGPGTGPGPEQLKEDIRTFIRDLERIRGGELRLLDEKISFFEKWVESPERQEMLEGLRATAAFLEKGDTSALEKMKRKAAGDRVQGRG